MKKYLALFLTFALIASAAFTPAARADDGPAAQAAIEKLGERAMNAIADKSLDKSAKASMFRTILSENFDMETAGRFAAGRHWRELDNTQRREFLKLYEDMIIRVYTARFESYNGQKFHVTGHRVDESGDVMVNSQITGSGAPISVAWRVRPQGKSYRVIDVMVEGVSMAVTQRNDFASVIQRGGNNAEALLTYLRRGGTSDIK